MTTINETVASIVAVKSPTKRWRAFTLSLCRRRNLPTLPRGEDPAREDFNQAMRRIRLHVDELLKQGASPKQKLIWRQNDKSWWRRATACAGSTRLISLFMAAMPPARLGGPDWSWLHRLRAQSGSLKAFVDRAAGIASLDDLLRALGER